MTCQPACFAAETKLARLLCFTVARRFKRNRRGVPCLAPEITRSLEILDRGKRQVSKETSRKLHQDMDREHMKLAILKQEQTFRQQVHELHRLYHVQKQLMQQMQPVASSYAPAIINIKPKQEFQIFHHEKRINPEQIFSLSSSKAPAPSPAEDCSLELTLATGPSSSSSSGNTGRPQGKRLKTSSNSESGTTAVSSTSTESELALFGEVDVTKTTVRFQGEARRMDEMWQGAWMYQGLSLKTA